MTSSRQELPVTSFLVVAMPFVTSSFMLLVVMPGATSSDALATSRNLLPV